MRLLVVAALIAGLIAMHHLVIACHHAGSTHAGGTHGAALPGAALPGVAEAATPEVLTTAPLMLSAAESAPGQDVPGGTAAVCLAVLGLVLLALPHLLGRVGRRSRDGRSSFLPRVRIRAPLAPDLIRLSVCRT